MRHIGAAQRKHLAKSVERRRKHAKSNLLMRTPTTSSPRSVAKAAAHETYIDQVALDKLQGLESGKICHNAYRRPGKWKPETRQKRKNRPRAADTYRGKRTNDERGPRQSLILKAERLRNGETRSEADRRRQQAAA